MDKQIKKIVSYILVFIFVLHAKAQFSEFGSAVLLQKDNVNTYYNLSGSEPNLIGNTPFSGNLGTFTQNSGRLSLKGAEIRTWKEYTANVCGATLHYIIYKENERPSSPVFSGITLPWKENCSGSTYPTGGACSNIRDQKWSESTQNIDLSSFSPANYILEVYITFKGSVNTGNGCETTYYVGNYGNNYKMSFSILPINNNPIDYTSTDYSNDENYIYSRTYLVPVDQTDPSAKQVQGIQYFDGLGRPKQSIAIKASPLGRDVVTHIEYDPFGRQVKDYLPVPQSSSQNGTIYSSPLSNASASYGAEKIYSEKVLENSPLDRVFQQVQPGNDWSGKPIKFDYLTNIGDAVKKYTVTTTWAVANTDIYTTTSSLPAISTYADNTLYKNKVTDEDGNVTYEFKNGQGQTLLVRKVLSTTENADTYYVYNEYNQLALVIPPLAAVKTSLIQSDLDELCYQYRYDNQNRLVEKKLPGKGWEYMVYDQQDRLVLTQDAMLRGTTNNFTKRGWLFTKYDQLGRVVYTGFFANTATRETMQKSLNSMSTNAANKETRDDIGFLQNGLTVYYTNTAFPTESMTILSVNYYDQYPADLTNIPTTVQGETILTATSQTTNKINTKSLPLASFVKNIDTDSWTKNYTFYDLKARAIGTHSYNYLGGYTKTESKLDFSGVATETYTYHKRLSSDTDIIVKERFEYDAQNRLVKHFHQVNTNPEELLTFNEYNELGQLKNKKVGGNATSPLQTVDYKYNIRGWMTGINDPTSLGTDLFGYKMKYNNPANITLAPAKYNGNISEIDWKTSKDNNLRRYGYIYDNLNRLNIASYQKPEASVPETHSYDESIYYDLNGNILTLQRNGTTDGVAGTQIDDLEYYYTGNQLTKVVDVSANYDGYPDTSGNIISYDANGNMTSLLDKEIKTISYNFLNLPNKITFTGVIGRTTTNINTINSYRADGVKIKKAHQSPNLSGSIVTKTIDYLDGFQYETVNTEATALQFVPTSEGYYDFTKNLYIYNYVDHLGNVRLSYADSNKNGIIDPSTEIIEENNYYPFGLKHSGYNNLAGNPKYQYKYNGKELQETGMYDYGARFYMPDIGRWGVQDQLSEKFFSNSNYNYVGNNPILIFDPDGRDWYYTNDGHYEFNKGLTKDNAEQFFKDNNIVGAKYAFENNTMGSMYYGSNGIIYDDSAAGGGLPYESGKVKNIDEVVINTPKAIANRNIEAARSRLREAEANYWGGYAYGLTVGYRNGNAGASISLFQNFGTGQVKLLGTTSLGTETIYIPSFIFQFNTLATYGNNPDGSKYKDVFGGALGNGTEASASYIFGGSVSTSATDRKPIAPLGTVTTGINLAPSFGGGVSRTSTTDLTPALNRFLKFNWIQHRP